MPGRPRQQRRLQGPRRDGLVAQEAPQPARDLRDGHARVSPTAVMPEAATVREGQSRHAIIDAVPELG